MNGRKLRLVTTAEVKEILEREMKEREEPTNEQKYAKEHADRFAKIKSVNAEKLVDELIENVPRVREHLAYKLVDFLPEHPDDVRVIFSRERYTLNDKEIEQILEIVSGYLPKE